MNVQIEWIKQVVGLCMSTTHSEEEKREYFEKLEKHYHAFTEEQRESIRNIMATQFEVNDMIYVFSIIVRYMKAGEFEEALLAYILRGSFDCYVGSMLELQSRVSVKGEYAQKRKLHKKNLENFDRILGVNYPYIPVEKRNKKRIVIVTEQLLSLLHAPTKVVCSIAYVLQECLGYEVLIFVCPCDGVMPKDLWYQPAAMNSNDMLKNQPMRMKYRDAVFFGYQINMSPVNPKEYSMMFSLIHAWNPLFVFDLGTANPVVDLVKKFTTLVSMGMSIACPISEGAILIRLDKADEESEREYAEAIGENQLQLFMEEKFPVIVEHSQNSHTRTELSLPEEKFLIAVVGNRLDTEIDNEFVQVMRAIVEKVPNAAFAIIGEVHQIKKYFEDEVFHERIYYLGYCKDLTGTYEILDLYINPKRKGGGFSSAMALIAKLPVVTLPDCDVAYNCGEEFVVRDYEEMIDTVCLYAENKNFYAEKKKCAQAYKEKNTDEKLVQYVEKMLDSIIKTIEEK